jgi:hypothetical protein
VDAICIDQDSLEDKAMQIKEMGKIFGDSMRTIMRLEETLDDILPGSWTTFDYFRLLEGALWPYTRPPGYVAEENVAMPFSEDVPSQMPPSPLDSLFSWSSESDLSLPRSSGSGIEDLSEPKDEERQPETMQT